MHTATAILSLDVDEMAARRARNAELLARPDSQARIAADQARADEPAATVQVPAARNVRGTAEYVADRQNRLGAIARRAQIGLDFDLELELSGVGEGAGGQLDLFATGR